LCWLLLLQQPSQLHQEQQQHRQANLLVGIKHTALLPAAAASPFATKMSMMTRGSTSALQAAAAAGVKCV
jgi:hypothetical protein